MPIVDGNDEIPKFGNSVWVGEGMEGRPPLLRPKEESFHLSKADTRTPRAGRLIQELPLNP
jgi:hypothetical protein